MIAVISIMAVLTAAAFGIYLTCNRGMSRKARGQQGRRFVIAAVVAALPAWVTGIVPMALLLALLWMVSYPLLYHLTFRRSSPDYENYGDTAFGLYLAGLLSALTGLLQWSAAAIGVVSVVEFALLVIPIVLWGYYLLYGSCIDINGMKILQETHYNEILEFARSYAWWRVLATALLLVALLAGIVAANGATADGTAPTLPWMAALAAYCVAIGWYLFKPHHSLFSRTGFAALWLDVKDYSASNDDYLKSRAQRLKTLTTEQLGTTTAEPHTLLMVIGESASRDYMSAFTTREHDTTPWLRQMTEDQEHSVAFPHAYSCAMHTVQVLEKSLTEMNQYGSKAFSDSCSIVDIAHSLGYRVHWYSNQGHLGAANTPITIVAETSDVAKWTRQELGRVQYDETLLSFLDELDTTQNNLLVLHLKGSHFNFLNRYPAEHTVWGEAGVQDDVLNYENSLRYTDGVLHQAFDYCRERLNLQAMIYFSDHATVPNRRRSPRFLDFGDTRIPLVVWFSESWKQHHPDRWAALRQNASKYWTNDLAYELVCGVMDVRSNCFDETASLASPQYKYEREDLLTYEGKQPIAADND